MHPGCRAITMGLCSYDIYWAKLCKGQVQTDTFAMQVPEILKPIRANEGNTWQHLPWLLRSCYSVRRTPWSRSFALKHQPESQKLRINADNSPGFSTRESETDIIM